MPNHVHVLFTPQEGFEIGKIVQAWKSVSARRINAVLNRRGQLWQEDYFDRFIRDAPHFERVLGYIEWNPPDAGLCELPEEWPYGSARRAVGVRPSGRAVGARTPSSAGLARGGPEVAFVAVPYTNDSPPSTTADEGVRAPTAQHADEGVRAHTE
jgi:hypothetical protein